MKRYEVKLKSKTPYMQHRMDDAKLEEWEKLHSLTVTRTDVAQTDAVRAEYHCYRNAEGKCYIPSSHLIGSLITAGTYVKSKVGAQTKSMKSIVAGMFIIEPFEIIVPDYDTIDKRSAVNKVTKARIITIRPMWSKWEVSFTLLVDNDTIALAMIKQLFDFAGNNVGIGSFRPTNNGMYGRFELVDIKEV